MCDNDPRLFLILHFVYLRVSLDIFLHIYLFDIFILRATDTLAYVRSAFIFLHAERRTGVVTEYRHHSIKIHIISTLPSPPITSSFII